jgi:hypothetical protein
MRRSIGVAGRAAVLRDGDLRRRRRAHQALPVSLAAEAHPIDSDHIEDDVAAVMAEVVVAARIAQAAQESLKMRVEVARRGGASGR